MSMTVTGGMYGNYAIQNRNDTTKKKETEKTEEDE